MRFRFKKKKKSEAPDSDASEKTPVSEEKKISVGEWKNTKRPSYRKFPVPGNTDGQLRVAFEGDAYADLVHHARTSLDAEICGVFAGDVNKDEDGLFICVRAAIRGDAARQESSHVTFTQETWNNIHQTMENEYPEMQIVGWYHTHPGFGVEFSEMDIFIQKNFFPLPTQIALVTDPLSGDVAVCVNTDNGTEKLKRFWVNNREIRCRAQPDSQSVDTDTARFSDDLQSLETRLNQFMQIAEDRRRTVYSVLSFICIFVLMLIMLWIGFSVFKYYTSDDNTQPQIQDLGTIPLTFRIDKKTVILEVQVRGLIIAPESDKSDNKNHGKEQTQSSDK